jgi:hypothetical protein
MFVVPTALGAGATQLRRTVDEHSAVGEAQGTICGVSTAYMQTNLVGWQQFLDVPSSGLTFHLLNHLTATINWYDAQLHLVATDVTRYDTVENFTPRSDTYVGTFHAAETLTLANGTRFTVRQLVHMTIDANGNVRTSFERDAGGLC